jgi:hypothetical protein
MDFRKRGKKANRSESRLLVSLPRIRPEYHLRSRFEAPSEKKGFFEVASFAIRIFFTAANCIQSYIVYIAYDCLIMAAIPPCPNNRRDSRRSLRFVRGTKARFSCGQEPSNSYFAFNRESRETRTPYLFTLESRALPRASAARRFGDTRRSVQSRNRMPFRRSFPGTTQTSRDLNPT